MRDDAELLRAWSQGDQDAGRAFVERYFDDVFAFIRSKVARGAEDLTQQVFAACASEPQRYRGEGSARAFLLGIARRLMWKYFRSERRYADALRRGAAPQSALASPSSLLRARDEVQVLHAALQTLPLDMQILLELHYWEELTMTDIAEVMEIPVGTVKSRIARARADLATAIENVPANPVLIRSSLGDLDRWAGALRAEYRQ